ncbi:carbohydrate ABC transporter permease [Sulfobacillus sp. hq2]|uniref:carbohydrate ABC transporter permease n=1 Tax=Sulfobacillus sp. hq2 TaxID=2039167 RepID=UPI001570AEF0|nr:sugar ABC transporter permease [Sulfobacillus sp. hq2]MCY0908923.1 sugar ABC transporter permease [Sulfobacillus thermotolerans]
MIKHAIKDTPSSIPTLPQPRRRWSWDKASAILVLAPSLVALGIFVYGFIFWNGYISLTNWNSYIPNFSYAGLANYLAVFRTFRFQSDIRNIIVFTTLFILGCLSLGLFLAVLIDQKIRFESLFRSIFIFPMAISFVATGVIWAWVLNPQPNAGVNLILRALGDKHPPTWFLSPLIIPSLGWGQIKVGVPLALVAVAIAAVWQMSGFAMAIYLAGLRAVPEEIKEAARIDGAGSWRLFWSVIYPQLASSTVTAVIILTAASLKVFGLVYAMTGPGQDFSTDMPTLNMFDTTFQGSQFAQGAAIATILFLLMAAFSVPYLISVLRRENREEEM